MVRMKINKIREERIEMEAVVDAYDESERAMGWYYYLEGKIVFPFQARCIRVRDVSPLKKGEVVNVIGMAKEEECESDMFVRIEWDKRKFAVPLSQLQGISIDEDTKEAIEDWHYWVAMGYEF